MIPALVLIPTLTGLLAFWIKTDRPRRALLVVAALSHATVTLATWVFPPEPLWGGWLVLDDLGRVFLSIASAIFLAAAVYAAGHASRAEHATPHATEAPHPFSAKPEVTLTACLLLFLASMSLITVSGNFGLLWVAVEASTLASAPLIFFHRHARSLEATWKYLVVCSVGVALALLGNFFLAVAAESNGASVSVLLSDLMEQGPRLQTPWLKAAFLFFLVGYGTKMGLAPLHSWLPDAHSESPAFVSALLSGALLNCAFLAILRLLQVCEAAGIGDFARQLLAGFGLFSMAVAGIFILNQSDFKRMLAYSSVEHMGILAFGTGLGGTATFGAMLHSVNHSITKAMLFLVAGNILGAYGSKSAGNVRGVLRFLPVSGVLWVAGFFAISGSPPFGPFLSEFTIFRSAIDQGHIGMAALFLGLLAFVFVGMSMTVLRMAQGCPPAELKRPSARESWFEIAPPAALGAIVVLLGVYIPGSLGAVLHEAARMIGGQ